MFAKTALVATIAVAAQAISLRASAPSTFADDDFLTMGSLENFEQAQAAREKYVKEHMARNVARAKAAHVYYNAKDTAAEKVRIEGEFNVAWLKSVTVHENAILDHNNAKESTIQAANAKRLAILAHLQATEAANKTDALRLHALAAWNAAKVRTAEARQTEAAAREAERSAAEEHDRTERELADREGEEAAADEEHKTRDSNHSAALATKAQALETETAAKAKHEASVKAEEAADAAERVAARARAAAFTSHRNAVEETKAAMNEKAAALARAIAASKAVREHMQANW
jgi:hypothetical protein